MTNHIRYNPPSLEFAAHYYDEIAEQAEMADREPEEFVNRSLRLGMYFSDIVLQRPTVIMTIHFACVNGSKEYPLQAYRSVMVERQGETQFDVRSIQIDADLPDLVDNRPLRLETSTTSFVDWSLQLGSLWEYSGALGLPVTVVSGVSGNTTKIPMTPLDLSAYQAIA